MENNAEHAVVADLGFESAQVVEAQDGEMSTKEFVVGGVLGVSALGICVAIGAAIIAVSLFAVLTIAIPGLLSHFLSS